MKTKRRRRPSTKAKTRRRSRVKTRKYPRHFSAKLGAFLNPFR